MPLPGKFASGSVFGESALSARGQSSACNQQTGHSQYDVLRLLKEMICNAWLVSYLHVCIIAYFLKATLTAL